ncbi:MAG TPA: sn-glycerol-3-phosphate import ATP-binding protein UgpC [Stellaceae bacterium]|nr:sn-glycerol-3-phosphate import ATP-binding protein UgpC [Stellaceae bacterium]
MAQVSLRDVRKSYAGNEVIHGVSCEIADGELIVIVGPSGCGKSTLLRMVAGLEDISAGEVAIGARVVNAVEPKDRDIAMVFQNYALYPHMTVFGNMAYGLKIRGLSKREITERVGRAAEILQLDKLLDRKPRALSGGQRQRVAMGRAIVRDPQVFLFDEPLSNLDAKLRVQMRVEIKKLQQTLTTTSIYVTHDQVEAMTLADRLIVMNAGIAEQIGVPIELYERPASVFVAGFIGSPAMNFLPGRAADGHVKLDGGTALPLPPGSAVAPGRAVTVGLRPEHFAVEGAAVSLNLAVELVEMLGADTIIHGKIEGAGPSVLARLPGTARVSAGHRVPLTIAPEQIHLFDAATGKRV